MATMVEHGPDFILVTFADTLSVDDLNQAADAIDIIDRTSPGRDRLIDATAVTGIQVDFEAVTRFAEDRRRYCRARRVKAAVLVTSNVMFGLARMYEQMLENPRVAVEVFRDRAAALAWLGVSPGSGGPKDRAETP
jgi:hypothetical protein